ncbi:uncharacterized protein LOC119984334 isoform X2 [Tripterygium wilfordii]|uniref:uncharacterized protein LOC119984334 isoform X2 n=1 Tax=Tripterygium wilfordii TaxID=458696 RepID=UPI0018F83C37|nr:uncharacterized protein LOC119984334 isoform X2 [Tripterygium wilfordii]
MGVVLGGDGNPRFLCDMMLKDKQIFTLIEDLAKHLRCVEIYAAILRSKKPDSRKFTDQAYRENIVLLTRDAKLLRVEMPLFLVCRFSKSSCFCNVISL